MHLNEEVSSEWYWYLQPSCIIQTHERGDSRTGGWRGTYVCTRVTCTFLLSSDCTSCIFFKYLSHFFKNWIPNFQAVNIILIGDMARKFGWWQKWKVCWGSWLGSQYSHDGHTSTKWRIFLNWSSRLFINAAATTRGQRCITSSARTIVSEQILSWK